jgi:type I restriction enzyme M protein
MADIATLERKIEQIIDELKGLCQTNGLSNQASEEVVITSVFLYKFLNDKFMFNLKEFATDLEMDYKDVLKNDNSELDAFYDTYSMDVAFTYDETIEYLINKVSFNDFYKIFDDALERISNDSKNETFSVETADGTRKPLFTRITENVESSKRNNFAKNIFGIISQERFDFGEAFKNNFDFYSRIFEYLIKDYNVASGVYAEYFTPQAISSIIAKILVQMSPVEDKLYDIYDPSAGSGSLVLHLANELGNGSFGEKAQVYTQDISGKSSRFLRINMMLNGLTGSLDNIIEGDTLDTPAHYNTPHDPSSGVRQFDYITSNPPFKMDFSSTRDNIEQKWAESEERDGIRRFFAGIPKVPNKKKESMAIYLCFIQHILWSLKDNGKAAIVVPTGFITAQSGIEKTIRQTIIDKKWLKGVISFPSNIFANTGTNVSVLFIDKSNKDGEIMLVDASKLGTKVKDGKNQKTVLSDDEIEKIYNTFINQEVVDDFSVNVTYEQITEKNYSFSAGQYFEVKIEYVEITQEEFEQKMETYTANLDKLFAEGKSLEDDIKAKLGELMYES